jgi:hypothetical protein
MYKERTRYTAPSPYDEPTGPIDVQALRAWWARGGNNSPAQRQAAYYGQRRARPRARGV